MIDTNKLISNDFFMALLHQFQVPNDANVEALYKVYCASMKVITDFMNKNPICQQTGMVNPLVLFSYILAEYGYAIRGSDAETIKSIHNATVLLTAMTNACVDKYLTLEHFKYNVPQTTNRYFPPLTSLDHYVTNILRILDVQPQYQLPDTLMTDMFHKFFAMCHCIIDLLASGYETEALATWRTLHETECILILLCKHPEIIPTYLKHIQFSLAFRDTIVDKEQQDKIFAQLKGEMKELGLKSKDMKRYIENGWIYAIPGVKEDPNVKINFRMGIEYCAGLESMNEWYEVSSEIAHGSPLLVYSDKTFFFNMALIGVFESFVRVEELFNNTFIPLCNDEQKQTYDSLRKIRLSEIKKLLEIEKHLFESRSDDIINSLYPDGVPDESELDKEIE